jgi:RHS repeat-associated protein
MITSKAPSGTVTTYGYDGAENRTSVKVGTSKAVTTTYDGAGLPTSSSDGTSFAHDAVGNLTLINKSGNNPDWYFAYNSWGNLKSAAHASSGTPDVSYTVDALDRVLSRTAGATTTSYTYRGTGEDAVKIQVGSATPVHYALTPGGPLATRTGTDPATLRYYLRNLHGDVVGTAATSGTNRVKGSILYSPWGVPGARTGEMSTSPAQGYLGFQGDLTDASTGQVDMLTRYYEPTLGRFTKRDVLFGDPTEPMSLNQYVYGADSPVTFTDPSGMVQVAGGGGGSTRVQQSDVELYSQSTSGGREGYSPAVVQPEIPSTIGEGPAAQRVWTTITNENLDWHDRIDAAWTYIQANPEYGRDLVRAWSRYEKERMGATIGDGSWNPIRHERNESIEAVFALGTEFLERKSEDLGSGCQARGANGLTVCDNAFSSPQDVEIPLIGVKIRSGGVTIGDTFYAAVGTDATDEALLHHERRHSDWYAIMGGFNFVKEYIDESVTTGPCNFLEYAAGWKSGGYKGPGTIGCSL